MRTFLENAENSMQIDEHKRYCFFFHLRFEVAFTRFCAWGENASEKFFWEVKHFSSKNNLLFVNFYCIEPGPYRLFYYKYKKFPKEKKLF